MKKIIILMVCLWGLGNTFTSAQTTEKEKFISSLMKQMTLDEKIGSLHNAPTEGILPDPTVEIFLKKSMSGKAE